MVLSKSGGDGPHHFEKWWGRDPTVRYASDFDVMFLVAESCGYLGIDAVRNQSAVALNLFKNAKPGSQVENSDQVRSQLQVTTIALFQI